MKRGVYLRPNRKFQCVRYWSHPCQHLIRTIKTRGQLFDVLFSTVYCLQDCNFKNTQSPTLNSLSLLFLSACCFIRLLSGCKLFFKARSISSLAVKLRSMASMFESPGIYGQCRGGACPYITSYRVRFMDEWKVVLYHHSTMGSHLLHPCGYCHIKALR